MSAGVRGYGLIEMMIAIAIVAVLAVLGTPMYVSWLSSTRIRSAAESVQNGLRLARTEAVQSARPA
ncbi:MAG TPA: prepilin-type N-terminal cleavage/methylation domain-containing protein, partial [Tahibacter sp.]|nr:prepilin-type N-terminal cleavage/methylation domain-containing protein [Tahibacter sp.]